MLKINLKFITLFSLLIFLTSCSEILTEALINDDPDTQSCIDIDKISASNYQTNVFSTDLISFKISNNCGYNIDIIEAKIETSDPQEYYFETIPTAIPENGLTFNVAFSPKSVGNKKAIMTLKNSVGSIVIELNNVGI